jgi:anthranilate synthase/aminodeoxychorismate synthase-like glutamine amidotransferase
LYQRLPFFGVCLGHQVIAEALGGRIVRAARPVHGQATNIVHEKNGLFDRLPSPFLAGRYHSLVVEPATLPAELRATAWSSAGELMAFEHTRYPVFGVQFHPESILTEQGFELLANFLRCAGLSIAGNVHELATSEMLQPFSDSTA